MPDTARVLWQEIRRIARNVDALTLRTFNPVVPTATDRDRPAR